MLSFFVLVSSLLLSQYEHARTPREKEQLRSRIFNEVSQELVKNPTDLELHKSKILFSKPEEKVIHIRNALKTVGIIPKDEVRFFVIQSVDAGEKKLAQDFLDKAKGWYTTSRVIERSQRYIDKTEE